MKAQEISPNMTMKHFSQKISSLTAATAFCAALAGFSGAAAQAQTPVYPVDLTNIAAAANGGRIIESTSTFETSAEWSADNLIDGKVFNSATNAGSMGWSSNKFDPVTMDSVTIGFGDNAIKRIGKVVLNPASGVAPERWAKDVEIQVSKESPDGPYRSAGIVTLRREAKPQSFLIFPVEAKYVRLLFRSNQGSDRAVALGEVEMYEAISQNDTIGQLIASMEQAINELKQYKEMEVRNSNRSGALESPGDFRNVLQAKPGGPSEATIQLVQLLMPDEKVSYPLSKTNIAASKNGGKIVDFSSLFGNDPAYAATNLLDGLTFKQGTPAGDANSSGWASEGFKPGEQFVTVGFGDNKSHLIGKVVLNPASDQAVLRWARRVQMEVTNGDSKTGPWKIVGTLAVRSSAVNQEFLLQPTEAKYVRFVFQANGPADIKLPGMIPGVNSDRAVSLGEIEMYEATSSNDALEAVIGRFTTILDGLKRLPRQKAVVTAEAGKTPVSTPQTS